MTVSIRDASDATNRATDVILAEIDRWRRTQLTRALNPVEWEQLMQALDRLAAVESNRTAAVVAAIAGRGGLDKLPPQERAQLIRTIAGLPGAQPALPAEVDGEGDTEGDTEGGQDRS